MVPNLRQVSLALHKDMFLRLRKKSWVFKKKMDLESKKLDCSPYLINFSMKLLKWAHQYLFLDKLNLFVKMFTFLCNY